MVPVIIGKGGATIRRLGEQSGGAEFKLDSSTGRLSITGRKVAVQKAVALLDDEAVVELVRSRSVHVECCPTSSWLTGGFAPKSRPWPEHPVCAFHRRGVSCGQSGCRRADRIPSWWTLPTTSGLRARAG